METKLSIVDQERWHGAPVSRLRQRNPRGLYTNVARSRAVRSCRLRWSYRPIPVASRDTL